MSNINCMHQCKIFVGFSSVEVENEVNFWLRENPNIAVFDITFSQHRSGEYNVFVLYDPNDYRTEEE